MWQQWGWSLQSVTALLNAADHSVYLFTLAHCIASQLYLYYFCLQCFDAVGWAAGRASGLYKTEWWGTGMVI